MKSRKLAGLTALVVIAVLALPLGVAAQDIQTQNHKGQHHHYKLVDIGTLGGPFSAPSGPGAQILNNRGEFVAYADTATPNPNANCAIPFNANAGGGDCFVEHPVLWHDGTLTDLELLPGGVNGQTVGLSGNGLIVGFSENGLLDQSGLPVGRAVLWTKDRKIIDLGAVPGGTVSLATFVNDRGEVVGFSDNGIPDAFSMAGLATQTRAFLWRNGVMSDLGTLGGTDASAFSVNERGQISGSSYTNSIPSGSGQCQLTTDPFFWENGKMTDIGSLGGTCGSPNWMNNRGQVVGFSAVAGDQLSHAFLWDKKDGLQDIGLLPGGSFGNAMWINDAGEIVGGSDSSNGFHAFLWKKGVMADLGNLPGDCSSQATSINSLGQIVGFGTIDCHNEAHILLFEKGSTPIDVNTLLLPGSAVTALNAFEINDEGEIAGIAILSNGDEHAALLIPCDEDHPGIEDCDYDTVDAATAAQVHPAPLAPSSAAASFARLSPAGQKARMRAFTARRQQRFGTRSHE